MDALNQKIKVLFEYLGSNKIEKAHNFLIDPSNKRPCQSYQYDPGKNLLSYDGWEESYHNGSSYDEVSLKIPIKSIVELNAIHTMVYATAFEKATLEMEAELAMNKKLEKEKKIEEFLISKISPNSVRFITSEEDKTPEPYRIPTTFVQDFYDRIKNADFIVEATHYEQYVVCHVLGKERRFPVVMRTEGFGKTVGDMKKPTTISYSIADYRGREILFWGATSSYVDYTAIEEFLEIHRPDLWRAGRKCDAQNFHNCLHHIDSLVDENSVKFIKSEDVCPITE